VTRDSGVGTRYRVSLLNGHCERSRLGGSARHFHKGLLRRLYHPRNTPRVTPWTLEPFTFYLFTAVMPLLPHQHILHNIKKPERAFSRGPFDFFGVAQG